MPFTLKQPPMLLSSEQVLTPLQPPMLLSWEEVLGWEASNFMPCRSEPTVQMAGVLLRLLGPRQSPMPRGSVPPSVQMTALLLTLLH